jgi:hypothetical protein
MSLCRFCSHEQRDHEVIKNIQDDEIINVCMVIQDKVEKGSVSYRVCGCLKYEAVR